MENLDSFCPSDLIIIVVLWTFLISDNKDAGDLNVLGNLIVSIGSLILTWAAQKEFLKTSENESNTNDTISLVDIKKQIKCLQDQCSKLEHNSSLQEHNSLS